MQAAYGLRAQACTVALEQSGARRLLAARQGTQRWSVDSGRQVRGCGFCWRWLWGERSAGPLAVPSSVERRASGHLSPLRIAAPSHDRLATACVPFWQAAHRRLHARQARLLCTAALPALSLAAAKDVAGLVVFSALPFVAVQALADSQAGKDLMARLEEQKPGLQREAAQRERERAAARSQRCGASTLLARVSLCRACL